MIHDENKKLRLDAQLMLSSRDPHISSIRATLLQLTSDTQRMGQRMSSHLTQLMSEFDRTVDTMQLVDSFKAFFRSFSELLRETYTADVDNLLQCARAAETADDIVTLKRIPNGPQHVHVDPFVPSQHY
jgi:hypothetical protein